MSRILRLLDADTGESELEAYAVPEGWCLTLAPHDVPLEELAVEDSGSAGYQSIILTPEAVERLCAHLGKPAQPVQILPRRLKPMEREYLIAGLSALLSFAESGRGGDPGQCIALAQGAVLTATGRRKMEMDESHDPAALRLELRERIGQIADLLAELGK